MPMFNYKCVNPSCKEYTKLYEHHVYNISEHIFCEHCKQPLQRQFPFNVHIVGVGKDKDGKDLGKVTKEKNESLKNKWAGYSYEEQNLRKKVTKMADEKIKQANL